MIGFFFLIQSGLMGFWPSPRLALLLQVDFCGGNELRKEGGGSVSSREETLRRTVRIHRRHRRSCLCHRTFPSHWKPASLPSLFTFLTRISSLGYRFEDRRPPAVFVSSPPPTSLNKTNGLSVSQPLSIDPPSERWIGLQGAMVHAEGRAAGQQGWNRVQQSHQVSDVSTPSWKLLAAVTFSSCSSAIFFMFTWICCHIFISATLQRWKSAFTVQQQETKNHFLGLQQRH